MTKAKDNDIYLRASRILKVKENVKKHQRKHLICSQDISSKQEQLGIHIGNLLTIGNFIGFLYN